MSSELSFPVNDSAQLSCWVVSDGKTGTENQCLGLASALGLTPTVKRIALRAPWLWLTPYVRGFEKHAFSTAGDAITPPFPDLLIASGRRSLPASFYVKNASPKTFVVQLQDPHCNSKLFDLVVVPEHDRLRGANVETSIGALHRVTPELLASEAAKWRDAWAHLQGPFCTVLVGGPNAIYQFDENHIMRELKALLASFSGSLLITCSRRTPESVQKAIRRDLLQTGPYAQRAWLWDGPSSTGGANPYFAMLGVASHIVVTADSVSMISEAATSGKPIHLIDLPGGSPKFERFYNALRQHGAVRTFALPLAEWDYEPLYETKRIAEIIRKKING